MKKKIKQWLLNYLKQVDKYAPKKSRDLRAVSFVSKQPINGKQSCLWLFQCTEWDNGEGFIFDISCYNEYSKQNEEKHYNISHDELSGILACLNNFSYFEE